MHLWIDGKLRSSYFGDTLAGASSVRFKFGPYMVNMHQATNEKMTLMFKKLINVKINLLWLLYMKL